ncbi:hypothetical protein BH09ACT12_BH09ACT12_05460 [soil metagenome]
MTDPTCPRCDGPMPSARTTGRPATWCSDRCKRAAYEERRAAANAAIAVKIVEKVVVRDGHDLQGCADRVIESPAACRRVLDHLALLARGGHLADPKWDAAIRSLRNLTVDLSPPRQGRPRL